MLVNRVAQGLWLGIAPALSLTSPRTPFYNKAHMLRIYISMQTFAIVMHACMHECQLANKCRHTQTHTHTQRNKHENTQIVVRIFLFLADSINPPGVKTLPIRDRDLWRQLSQETLGCGPTNRWNMLVPPQTIPRCRPHLDQLCSHFRQRTTLKPFQAPSSIAPSFLVHHQRSFPCVFLQAQHHGR